jgi:hypothetical protein
VKAYQVFSTHGPQPYALVVLGKFSGTLVSACNPARQGGASAQSATCRIVEVTITNGPQGLTNSTCARHDRPSDNHVHLTAAEHALQPGKGAVGLHLQLSTSALGLAVGVRMTQDRCSMQVGVLCIQHSERQLGQHQL